MFIICDMTYGTTADDQDFLQPVRCKGDIITRTPRAVGYKVLGTLLSFNNRNDLELERRIRAAWCAFHKHKLVNARKLTSNSTR